jgi:hypothetical protein
LHHVACNRFSDTFALQNFKSMRTIVSALFLLAGISTTTQAQVAINTTGAAPHPSALLDITGNNRGLLIPRMTDTEMQLIPSPATGLLVYNTTFQKLYNRTAIGWEVSGISPQLSPASPNATLYYNGSSWASTLGWQHDGTNTGLGQAPDLSNRLAITGNAILNGNMAIQGGTLRIGGGSPAIGKVLTAIDANGNATWQTNTGGVANRVLTVPFTAFMASNGLASSLQVLPTSNYAYFNQGTSSNARMVAPVYLPTGATVTGMSVIYRDASSVTNMNFQLVKTTFDVSSGSMISTYLFPGFQTSGSISSFSKISSPPISHTVEGVNSTYYVDINIPFGTTWQSFDLLVMAVEIQYTY